MVYPIVMLNFIDHSANDSGPATPCNATTIGILQKETEEGYYVVNWVFDNNLDDPANCSVFVAKVPGLKKFVLSKIDIEVSNG